MTWSLWGSLWCLGLWMIDAWLPWQAPVRPVLRPLMTVTLLMRISCGLAVAWEMKTAADEDVVHAVIAAVTLYVIWVLPRTATLPDQNG